MAFPDLAADYTLLARAVRDPACIPTFAPADATRLLNQARSARLRGWLLARLETSGGFMDSPQWLRERVEDARAHAAEAERSVLWEIDRLHRAFLGTSIPWVLLKGAGYLAAGLPPGRGRQVSDVDLLVPEGLLGAAESALVEHGWEPSDLDDYDRRYYREWMHELPPFVHAERRSVIDLHHSILPRTSRLQPSSARLLERAVMVGGVRVLCPSHMVLHAAAHLFHDGEVAGAIRDVVDIDGLLRHFGGQPGFWDDLATEARALGLTRPLFYAVRYAELMCGTPVPAPARPRLSEWAPAGPVLSLMDAFVVRALLRPATKWSSASVFALYVRSHWLRMPAPLLIRHLTRKAVGTRKG